MSKLQRILVFAILMLLMTSCSSDSTGNQKIDLDNVSFKMEIQDVFTVAGRGRVATGQIEIGTVYENSDVIIVSSNGKIKYRGALSGISSINGAPTSAAAGDSVGLSFADEKAKRYIKKGSFIVME